MPQIFSLPEKPDWKNSRIILQAVVVICLFSIALLTKIRILLPAASGLIYPIGYKDVFTSAFLYSAPFLFLLYCLVSRGEDIKFRFFDTLFGLIILMHMVSFFWVNRGFQPANPILTDLSIYFLYLLIRNIHSRWLKNHTLFLLLLPVIPLLAEACHGMLQMINGRFPVTGSFHNYNFLGMLLAMGLPVCASQVLSRNKGVPHRIISLLAASFLFYLILQTTSRTAACGVILALAAACAIYYWPLLKDAWKQSEIHIRIPAALAVLASATAVSYYIYSLRPLSVLGRGLLTRIGFFIFTENPLTGIGFGEIPPRLAKYQGEYFGLGNGSPVDRMLAGNPGAVTSEYLERAVESGIAGLLLYIPFWILILWMAFMLIRGQDHKSNRPLNGNGSLSVLRELASRIIPGEKNDMTRFSAGATLILFMVMSLSYSPYRIMPIYIYFSYILGIAVSLYECRDNSSGGTG